MKKEKILVVIAGPTAVGKTAVAIALAERFNTEIVSADSRQIFRELTIGTAKPSSTELAKVRHHFIDSHSIEEDYDAARYADDALKIISQLFAEKDVVVLCGGSGLYIKGVCEGFDEIPDIDDDIRSELKRSYEQFGLGWLQSRMQQLDPVHYSSMDQQNPQRLMRALEVKMGTGRSISDFRTSVKRAHNFRILKFGLDLPREDLYRNIDTRMDNMIVSGLFKEAENLYTFRQKNALQTVGYQEVFGFIEGKYDYNEAVRLLKRNSRRYAKRQLTWFKKDPGMQWFHPTETGKMIQIVESYL